MDRQVLLLMANGKLQTRKQLQTQDEATITEEQRRCPHREVRGGGNQHCYYKTCKACHLRVFYQSRKEPDTLVKAEKESQMDPDVIEELNEAAESMWHCEQIEMKTTEQKGKAALEASMKEELFAGVSIPKQEGLEVQTELLKAGMAVQMDQSCQQTKICWLSMLCIGAVMFMLSLGQRGLGQEQMHLPMDTPNVDAGKGWAAQASSFNISQTLSSALEGCTLDEHRELHDSWSGFHPEGIDMQHLLNLENVHPMYYHMVNEDWGASSSSSYR